MLKSVSEKFRGVARRDEPVRAALAARLRPVPDARPMHADDAGDFGCASEGGEYRGSGLHGPYVAHIATEGKRAVAILSTDARRDTRYAQSMLKDWFTEALKHSGLSQAEMARRLTTQLKRAIDRAAVNKMKSGDRAISGDELIAIEEITGYPAPLENSDGIVKVPLLDSLVSAGNLSPREAARPEDVKRYLAASDLPPGDWLALTVEGDSMDRVSPPGSTIFVNRADTRLTDGGFYVVTLESDDGTTYKRYRQHPDLFAPYSTNLDHTPILLDVPYRVVGRVYRTMLDVGPAAGRRAK
jgi:SOS-response transcriptional repressor LexA